MSNIRPGSGQTNSVTLAPHILTPTEIRWGGILGAMKQADRLVVESDLSRTALYMREQTGTPEHCFPCGRYPGGEANHEPCVWLMESTTVRAFYVAVQMEFVRGQSVSAPLCLFFYGNVKHPQGNFPLREDALTEATTLYERFIAVLRRVHGVAEDTVCIRVWETVGEGGDACDAAEQEGA